MRSLRITVVAALALGGLVACGDDATPAVGPDAPAVALLTCDEAALATSLAAVPGVSNVESKPCRGSARCFGFDFQQPVQHDAVSPTFLQHINLTHRGCDQPVVVADWGYDSFGFYESEVSSDYGANSMSVEHRFQGTSVPAPAQWDWTALTIRNAAQDLHAVISTFRRFYRQHWVSTGASKGGVTALYHRYFFPTDVNGTVAYVAPASRARSDEGYQAYMKRVLPADCAQRMRDFQAATLTARRDMLLRVLGPGFSVGDLENEMVYWDWSFWQYNGIAGCAAIPTAASSDQEFADYALADLLAPPPATLAPQMPDPRSYGALSYEWLTEQGFASQVNDTVTPLLSGPTPSLESYFVAYFGDVALPAYNGTLTAYVRNYALINADHLVLVYGQNDPWSGGAFDEPQAPASGRFFVANGNHGAEISMLPTTERARARDLVAEMLGKPRLRGLLREAATSPSPIFAAIAAREAAMQRRMLVRTNR